MLIFPILLKMWKLQQFYYYHTTTTVCMWTVFVFLLIPFTKSRLFQHAGDVAGPGSQVSLEFSPLRRMPCFFKARWVQPSLHSSILIEFWLLHTHTDSSSINSALRAEDNCTWRDSTPGPSSFRRLRGYLPDHRIHWPSERRRHYIIITSPRMPSRLRNTIALLFAE